MIAVIVPSNRPDSLARWQAAWAPHLAEMDARLYVVLDEPATWTAIDADLGENAWIIPRRTDCIRSYGYLQAYRDGAEYFVTLDDDCYPAVESPDAIRRHVLALQDRVDAPGWVRTLQAMPTRGLPRWPVGINHGLWTGVPDVDAVTQLAGYPASGWPAAQDQQTIPIGSFFPMSGMNLAWRRELTPLMYFGLQGTKQDGTPWGVDRFGDIWCGIFAKLACDHLGYAVTSGLPYVRHERASDPAVNKVKEAPGQAINRWLYRYAAAAHETWAGSPAAYMRHLANAVDTFPDKYFFHLADAMGVWADLLDKES